MLLCGIIEDLEKNPQINSSLGYFFCQATDSRINTAASVVAGLTFSLIKRYPIRLSPICEKHKDKLSQLDGPNAWAVLCDIFKAVTQDPVLPDPVCVVDALDECEHDCKLLLSLIVKTSANVKWLLSSRNVKDIERGLRAIEPTRRLSLELKENAENVSKSVDAYINTSIQDIEALEDDEELQIKTATALKNKANGTFLWVALVIEQLRDTDRRNVEDVLEEMPEGLENLYDLIIRRANSKLRQKDREACRVLLSIVTTAERPLHLKELHVFISSQWKNYKATYDMRDMQDIVKDLGSLLSIRNDIIYFIHQSVKDYMVGYASKSIFPSGIEYQHLNMVKTSLDAMLHTLKHNIYGLKNPGSKVRDEFVPPPDPLKPIAYCCVFWVEHLVRGCKPKDLTAEEFFKDDGIIHSFLKDKYLCWLESLALLRSLVPHGADAIQKLKNLAASYCRSKSSEHHVIGMINPQGGEVKCLKSFIGDAYHFFHSCKYYVEEWPLQLYYSAVVFEDESSAIYKTFRQPIRDDFRDYFTFLKKPQRRVSLLNNIDVSRSVGKLLYSPNSSTLCVMLEKPSHGTVNTISLYRIDTGTLEREFKLNTDMESGCYVAFSPDSRHLIFVSRTGVVQILVIDSGVQVQQLSLNLDMNRVHLGKNRIPPEIIGLSTHGELAASTCYSAWSGDVNHVRIWSTKTGACVREIYQTSLPTNFNSKPLFAIFAPNSALIALMSRKDGAEIYSVRTGDMMKSIRPLKSALRFKPGYLKSSKFSADSSLLALLYNDSLRENGICLWCTKTWTMTRRVELGMARMNDFDLSPDASMFMVALWDKLVIGSTRTGQQLLKVATSDNASFSPDWPNSSLLASATSRTVQIWRADTKDIFAEMHSTASSMTISPGSQYAATRSHEGYINIWNGKSGECVQVLKANNLIFLGQVFSPNMEFFACGTGTRADARIWHLSTGESLHLLENKSRRSIYRISFSDDSKYLFIGYDNNDTWAWSVESGECLFRSGDYSDSKYRKDFEVCMLRISPDSKYMARASRSMLLENDLWEVRIWDWRAEQSVSSFDPRQSEDDDEFFIRDITFSSDATALVVICRVGEKRYEVQIWEVSTGTEIGYVDVGESYSPPLFDPITNKILTDRLSFCKRSSWEHWDEISRPGYSLSLRQSTRRRPERHMRYLSWIWVCFGGEMIFLFPTEFCPHSGVNYMAIPDSLLVYANSAEEIVIIQFPGYHESQRLEVEAVDSDDVSDLGLDVDGSSAGGKGVDYLAKGGSDPQEPERKD